jgi:CBS domain-containing protein
MQVQDVMTTSLVTVTAETSARAAADLLTTHGFAVLPVVGPGRRLIGVLSAAALDGNGRAGRSQVAARLTVGEVMSSPWLCISPQANVIEAATRMIAYRVDSVPVVDGNCLVGIVARSDLVHGIKADPHGLATEVRRVVTAYGTANGFRVSVSAGLVTISGLFDAVDGQAITSLAKAVPGVTEVRLRPWPTPEEA